MLVEIAVSREKKKMSTIERLIEAKEEKIRKLKLINRTSWLDLKKEELGLESLLVEVEALKTANAKTRE